MPLELVFVVGILVGLVIGWLFYRYRNGQRESAWTGRYSALQGTLSARDSELATLVPMRPV